LENKRIKKPTRSKQKLLDYACPVNAYLGIWQRYFVIATSVTWRIIHDVIKPTDRIELGLAASTVRIARALQGKPRTGTAMILILQ
jgi:hypothetical protein